MEGRGHNDSRYLSINGQKIAVSHEVYQMMRQENNRIRYRARCEQSCVQMKFSACRGDCQSCPWHVEGRVVSISKVDAKLSSSMAANYNVEDEVVRNVTMQQVYAQADQLACDGGLILQLRFEKCYSNREIAECLGVSHTAVNKRMNAMLAHFRKNKVLLS